MMMKRPMISAITLLITTFGTHNQTSASEWGCEVLLCAASSNPSWRGVASCVPPMKKLMSAMAKPGFSWPTCPEAGTGAPSFEKYDECPAGTQIGYSYKGHDGSRSEPDQCVKNINTCNRNRFSTRDDDNCVQTVVTPRPLRAEPYFFDIKRDSTARTERYWFELND